MKKNLSYEKSKRGSQFCFVSKINFPFHSIFHKLFEAVFHMLHSSLVLIVFMHEFVLELCTLSLMFLQFFPKLIC